MIEQKEKYKINTKIISSALSDTFFFPELISLVMLFLIVFHPSPHSVAFLVLLFLTAFFFLNSTDLERILWFSSFILKKPVEPFFLITHFVVNFK